MQIAKIAGLMTAMTLILVAFGQYLGGTGGAVFAFVLAMLMNFGTYWFSDRAVLRMVDRLRQRAELPMPTVAIAPSQQPNAFATGRNPEHAVVCVTTGIMGVLNERELEGVVAHELAHIKHRHMLVGTIAAGMAGAIGIAASMVRWGFLLGTGRDDDGGNPFVLLAMAIFAPIAAMIVQMTISRQNEFQADATGARIAGRADGLANALARLETAAQRIPMQVNPSAAHLAIVNPFASGKGPGLVGLFRTHPPTEQRIEKLRALQL